ncbi:hypothetical protein ICN32_03795 [Polynucleobacter wuianus]|uniref:hypothetical protein n=1 Tax=Polynucleobacter wuianus TaxID=1743168 RepID=UPI001C0B7591|nr:hypothetical protein [Polynucleobacter wuianus]MBU3609683.1 hypothetical protein [Polynucleobacter wuianus]
MNPVEIIQAAKSAGLRLEIDPENRLKVGGKKSIQEQFLPLLKEHKKEILEVLKQGENYPLLDDRHSCLECSNLAPQNWCRGAPKYGKWVAWIDSQWLDKKHRCERFRVKAVKH